MLKNTDAQTKTPKWAERKPLAKAEIVESLNDMASAAYACAKATTEPSAREGYMNRCHAMREAVRYLTR